MEETSGVYKEMLIGKWKELYRLGGEVRESYILEEKDIEAFAQYKSLLIRMWFELYPHVRGRKDIRSETIEKFMRYKRGCEEPKELDDTKLSEMEGLLGDVLVQLGVLSL